MAKMSIFAKVSLFERPHRFFGAGALFEKIRFELYKARIKL